VARQVRPGSEAGAEVNAEDAGNGEGRGVA
jgi:hypothetical protein